MDDGGNAEGDAMQAGDECGGGSGRGVLDDLGLENLTLRERLTIVNRCVTRTKQALDVSIDRLVSISSEHEHERMRARSLLSDLTAWCTLAEEHVVAIAREERP